MLLLIEVCVVIQQLIFILHLIRGGCQNNVGGSLVVHKVVLSLLLVILSLVRDLLFLGSLNVLFMTYHWEMDLIKLVDSLSKLLVEFPVLTQKSILELIVNSYLVDSTLEFFFKLLWCTASPDRLYVIELRHLELWLNRLAEITEINRFFVCCHLVFDILDLVCEEHSQVLLLLPEFMIAGVLTRLLRLYVLFRAPLVGIVKHVLRQLRVEFVIWHRG